MTRDADSDGRAATPSPPASPESFAGHFGIEAIARDLREGDPAVRRDAVERAAALALVLSADHGGPSAEPAWKLVREGAGDARGDDVDGSLRVRLAAARALAADGKGPDTKDRLTKLVDAPVPTPPPTAPTFPAYPYYPPGPPFGPPYPFPTYPVALPARPARLFDPALAALVRQTAAMALAVRGDFDVLQARAGHGSTSGTQVGDLDPSRAAMAALVRFPPPITLGTSSKGSEADLAWIRMIAAFGDVGAGDWLVGVATRALASSDINATQVSIASISALGLLGDGRVGGLAHALPLRATTELRAAAAEALARIGDPGAAAAIETLIELGRDLHKATRTGHDEDERAGAADPIAAVEGRRLALEFPSAPLIPSLVRYACAGDTRAAAALGAVGTAGVAALTALSRKEAPSEASSRPSAAVADAAAFALAYEPASIAADALETLLHAASGAGADSAELLRRVVRSSAVRAVRLRDQRHAFTTAARHLAASTNEADRSVGALYLAATSLDEAERLLRSADRTTRLAAAAGLLGHPVHAAAAVARARLASSGTASDDELSALLGAAIVREVDGSPEHDAPITSADLSRWLAAESSASSLAAFLLAARGGVDARPQIERALGADRIDTRVGALLGLGVVRDGSATATLAARYESSVVVELRRAAVRALIARHAQVAPWAAHALGIARDLDADAVVGALAAMPSRASGPPSSPLLLGDEIAFAHIVSAASGASAGGGPVTSRLATYRRADGLTIPVLVDPEGVVVVFDVPAGAGQLEAVVALAPPVQGHEAHVP